MSQGSGGNVIAALCSLIVPGVGQLVQGRLGKALLHVILYGLLWLVGIFGVIPLFLIMHVWSCLEAARWEPGR